MPKSQSRGAAQKHAKYNAMGIHHTPKNTDAKLAELARSNPFAFMAHIAALTGKAENGITSEQAKILTKKFLMGTTQDYEPASPEKMSA